MRSTYATATEVEQALRDVADPVEEAKIRGRVAEDEAVIGVRMGTLFEIAKQATLLSESEVAALLDHPAYEVRLTAFCILDFRARTKLLDSERADLARLYLDRHDAITSWDMVDRAAPRVLGWPVLLDATPYDVLLDLAHSSDPLRRRSAVTAPLWFIKRGTDSDVRRGLAIADRLAGDDHPRVRSAVKIFRAHAAKRSVTAS